MKLEVYKDIVSTIHSCWTKECFKTISEKFPRVTNDTLTSIYSQEFQKKVKRSHYKHHQPGVIASYYKRYLELVDEGDDQLVLLKIAKEIDLSPSILARIILEEYLSHTYCGGESVPKEVLSLMVKDNSLIPNERLSQEIKQCIINDENCGPLVDSIKHSIGLEYENILEKKLAGWKIPFLGENDMRNQGYDKTPDFKLQVPIAVDGQVINWIESKASFGDDSSHKSYLKDQFWSYWNRQVLTRSTFKEFLPVSIKQPATLSAYIFRFGPEWKRFVQNRVSEIQQLVPVSSWLHCPSEENMADVASRGTLASQLVENNGGMVQSGYE